MSKYPSRQDREELKALLTQYENLKAGRSHSLIEEDEFERIIEYFDEKEQLAAALEASELAIEQYPFSSNLLLQKASLQIALRLYVDALQTLEKAGLYDARNVDLYILKTDACLALDMQEKAAEILESALDDFSGEEKTDLLFELADVYDDYENFEKVFDCLIMILEQDANNEEALYKICFWTDFTGRDEESIRLHQNIIQEFPYNELAWFNLGAAYQGLKLHEKAIDAYQYALAIDEKFDYAYRNLGDAYIRIRKYREAIEALEKVLELSRPEYVIYEAMGYCYHKLQNFSQARFHYRKASHLNAEDSQLHYKIAGTYMNEGAWQPAIKCLQTALSMHRMQAEYHIALGRCFVELGKYPEAISAIGQAVKMKPKNINGWVELLQCMYRGKLFNDGIDYAALALESTDNKPIFLFYKSLFLFAAGKSKEAMVYLENGFALYPKGFKKIIELEPSLLRHQQVVEIAARFKKKKS